ncbi:MAG: fumarylacetoacetate hydrolase family protein [Actinomycetota bacterium]|nr:fumarylacetoacetate hydrolase family protein [Actinomycetota bacterium]
MRLATFVPAGASEPVAGEVRGGEAIAFAGGGTVRERLATGDGTPADGERWALDEVELLAPVPRPGAIYGISLNYASHAAETGGEPPERPLVFLKAPSSVAPPAGPVRCPPAVRRLDYEGELAAVIGNAGEVAGYAVADDVTARDLQGREPQWARAKGAATFCPWGPWIVTPDEAPDPASLRLRTWVNGELRQDAPTSDLLFDVPALVAFLSETNALEPGDLILTGTPGGVGFALDPARYLQDGDVVRVEVEGVGAIEHPVEVSANR